MPGIIDSKADRAGSLAHRLLIGHVVGDSIAVDRVMQELLREDDPELLLLVLDQATQVSTRILVMLAGRADANPRRAIEEAFTTRPPR